MTLSPPQVLGPVSVCSTLVRVKGQLTGATVSVFLNGDAANPIARDIANWADQVVHFTDLPPAGLQPGDTLTAVQTLAADESAPSPQAVQVQPFDPQDLAHLSFLSHLYICGRHLWLHGLAPGATLEVGSGGLRGRAAADAGNARVTIDPPLSVGELLQVRQVACGVSGPDNFGLEPDPAPIVTSGRKLRAPAIGKPAHACDRAVLVTGVTDGADVTLFRDAAAPITAGFDRDALWLRVANNPLKEGQKLSVSQAIPNCDHEDSDASTPLVTVLPADTVMPPIVARPLCSKATAVYVGGLTPGAKVRIRQDGQEIALGEAPDPAFAFFVPPLAAGSKITAQQGRCDIWSAESTAVLVDDAPADVSRPQIDANPLHECATAVPVRNIQRGSWLRVISGRLGQISAYIYVNTTEIAIPVSPALAAGDEIFVEQSGCAAIRLESAAVPVQSAPALLSPRIGGPVSSRDTAIEVNDVVSGAVVEVYLNGEFRKSVNPGRDRIIIPLGKLRVGDRINTRQILCNTATPLERDSEVVVIRPRPYPPVELRPDGRQTSPQPTLSWVDPHQTLSDQKADSFDLEIRVNGSVAFSDSVNAATHTITMDLPFSSAVEWQVRGRNPTGASEWSTASFDVESEPDPTGPSKLRIYNCAVDRGTIHLWLYDIGAGTLIEKGTLAHQHNQNGSCPAGGTPFEIALTDGHSYQLIAVDPSLGGCGINEPTSSLCQKYISAVFTADDAGPPEYITVG